MKRTFFGLLLLAGACRSADEGLTIILPPYHVATAWASDEATAQEVADLVTRYEPAIRELMGSTRETPMIVMLDEPRVEGALGVKARHGILLGQDARGDLSRAVIHELAHWHTFSHLEFPVVLEDGLATWTEMQLLGTPRLELKILDHSRDWWIPLLTAGKEIFDAANEDGKLGIYAFGWWLVDTIGFEELRAMHAAGRTSVADVVAAAGLAVDPTAEPNDGSAPVFTYYVSMDPALPPRLGQPYDIRVKTPTMTASP